MRIISGKLKGRRLRPFEGEHLRPTTDRVKETWFNILQAEIQGAHVLDLFAGTGNLGFEAWSRGAKSVTAVENNPKSIRILKGNQQTLKVDGSYLLKAEDVFKFLKTYKGMGFDLIFVDPPFTQQLADKLLVTLEEAEEVWTDQTIIGIESSRGERLSSKYGRLVCVDTRKFGDKLLSFFKAEKNL